MNWQDAALALAGVIGCGAAVFHGVLLQRLIVGPVEGLLAGETRMSLAVKRSIPPILHYSTYSWFLGGLALIAAAAGFSPDARLATGLLVGAAYLFGAVANFRTTRGRHIGWMLLATTVALIAYGLVGPAG